MNWSIEVTPEEEANLVTLTDGVECYADFGAIAHAPELGLVAVMRIHHDNDGAECTDLRLRSFGMGGDEAQRISARTLKAIPIDKWLREAQAVASVHASVALEATPSEAQRLAQELPRRRTAMTDQRLAEVVHVHHEAGQRGMSRVRAVAERFAVTDRTASRYIAEARSRGFIQDGDDD